MPKERPDQTQISAGLDAADRAVISAAEVRKRYFRRHSPQRKPALEHARQRCADATVPLRSWIGMAPWGGISTDDDLAIKRAMEALRYERRQIDKMLA